MIGVPYVTTKGLKRLRIALIFSVICDLDKQITEECEAKRLSLRSQAMEEILTSEFSYLRNIEIIMKVSKNVMNFNMFLFLNL